MPSRVACMMIALSACASVNGVATDVDVGDGGAGGSGGVAGGESPCSDPAPGIGDPTLIKVRTTDGTVFTSPYPIAATFYDRGGELELSFMVQSLTSERDSWVMTAYPTREDIFDDGLVELIVGFEQQGPGYAVVARGDATIPDVQYAVTGKVTLDFSGRSEVCATIETGGAPTDAVARFSYGLLCWNAQGNRDATACEDLFIFRDGMPPRRGPEPPEPGGN